LKTGLFIGYNGEIRFSLVFHDSFEIYNRFNKLQLFFRSKIAIGGEKSGVKLVAEILAADAIV
jgi:hypothetical protein